MNKAATRESIATAALDFLRNRDFNAFTVDDVAAAAGVSRRTFFNYFSSVEAAVASFTQNYLDQVIVELVARPSDEPLLESAQSALSAGGSARDLAILAETFTLTQDPQLARFQLQAWEECSLKITEVAKQRLPEGTDELYIFALVGAVVGSCKGAFQVWFQKHGTNITEESLADLRSLLASTVGLIRNGFHS
nr:TetR/AcrR family transcriptional regulator [Arthrobacter sp. E3]